MGQMSVPIPMSQDEYIESQSEEKSGKEDFHNARRRIAFCMDVDKCVGYADSIHTN